MTDRTLAALLEATPVKAQHGPQGGVARGGARGVASGGAVTQISQDSRDLQAGACFVAVPGFHVDGHSFLDAVVAAGAQAVVVQSDRRAQWEPLLGRDDVSVVEVADTRVALAALSAAFHGFPARRLTVVGVTGTDGKSTTCYLTSSILEAAGRRTGIIGGVQFKVGDEWRMNTITQSSPEAPQVQSLLAEMVAAGVTYAVIESTSHGLALHRLDGCEYDVGVFTGLSDDHLDFHKTREEYLAAKLRLFQALDTSVAKGTPKRGVVHADDPYAEAVGAATSAAMVRVGFDGGGFNGRGGVNGGELDVSAGDVVLEVERSEFRIATRAGAATARLALPGRFNVRNALSAAGACWALGVGPEAMARGIGQLREVPGRMERIEAGQPFTVVVDAAATAAAFGVVLAEVRALVQGRLIVVFGCAGERDPGRRGGMGAAAAEFADYAVLTSENPRSEDPAAIVREIAKAMEAAGRQAGADFEEEPDRRRAIGRAFMLASAGDYVLIAGKGAEQTLIVGETVEPWDDRAVARELLAGRQG